MALKVSQNIGNFIKKQQFKVNSYFAVAMQAEVPVGRIKWMAY